MNRSTFSLLLDPAVAAPAASGAAPDLGAAIGAAAAAAVAPAPPAAAPAAGSVLGNPTPTTDWRSSLPDELKTAPSLASFKDVAALAKSHVEVQKLVGVDRIEKPSDKWSQEKWNEFYDGIGRPKEPTAYAPPKGKEIPADMVDAKQMERFQKLFHTSGLSQKQGEAILGEYASLLTEGKQAMDEQKTTALKATEEALTKELGSKKDETVQRALAAVQRFGGQDLVDYLNQSGLGNNVALIKTFAAVGAKIADDTAVVGGSPGSASGAMDSVAAKVEINRLNSDPVFQKKLTERFGPGYKAAADWMLELHKRAYGSAPNPEE